MVNFNVNGAWTMKKLPAVAVKREADAPVKIPKEIQGLYAYELGGDLQELIRLIDRERVPQVRSLHY